MTVFPSCFLLICLFHCFKYGCPESVDEQDPTVILAQNTSRFDNYISIVPFDDVFKLTLTPGTEKCEVVSKLCLCVAATSGDNIKPNSVAPCGPKDSAICIQWDAAPGRFREVEFFTNSNIGDAYSKKNVLRKVKLEIPLKPDFPDKNVTTFKFGGTPLLPIATWASFMKKDSDHYGMIRYLKIKIKHIRSGPGCPIRIDLNNGAEWMPDVTALTPHVTEITEVVEEEEETTTESVAAAGMMPRMHLHSWIVCIVGLVIWMIWTVIYITLLALAFNRRLCFVMMDPPEVVEDVQVYSSGKNP
uniref:DUF5727 domain-containing protein n=1 Tax=Panagrellus redivivus TaxID=6233 RepID=A0A7E4VMZ3_PANRE